jgi:hypothetical protein
LCYFGNGDVTPYGLDPKRLVAFEQLRQPQGTLIVSSHCLARLNGQLRLPGSDEARNWTVREAPRAVVARTYFIYDFPSPASGLDGPGAKP